MAGVNKAIILGRLGRDPEVKFLPSGGSVCNFSVATSENWTDKTTGEKQERTEWHSIQVWGKLAEICGQYLSKGREVYVEGQIQTRSWEKDGETKYKTEIRAYTVQFIGGKGDARRDEDPPAPSGTPKPQEFGTSPSGGADDDIPF